MAKKKRRRFVEVFFGLNTIIIVIVCLLESISMKSFDQPERRFDRLDYRLEKMEWRLDHKMHHTVAGVVLCRKKSRQAISHE